MTTQDIVIHKDCNKATLNTTYDVVVCASLFTTKSIIVNEMDF
jgi:hypothetical protein